MTRDQVEMELTRIYGKAVKFDMSDSHAGYYFATDGAEFKLYTDDFDGEDGPLVWAYKPAGSEDWQYKGEW